MPPASPVRVTNYPPEVTHTSTVVSPGHVVTTERLSPGRTITEHAPRFVGSTNLATSTYIPATQTETVVTEYQQPLATTITEVQQPPMTTTITEVEEQPMTTSVTTGAITGNTYVSRVYSPTRRIAARVTSPSRVRIDSVGVHQTYEPQVTTTSTTFY